MMKIALVLCTLLVSAGLFAQCSICTRTAQQLGEQPAKGLNAGIVYLAFLPLAIGSVIWFKWRKNNPEG
jgi:hypothetical protein